LGTIAQHISSFATWSKMTDEAFQLKMIGDMIEDTLEAWQ
jgi:hypothetical protein